MNHQKKLYAILFSMLCLLLPLHANEAAGQESTTINTINGEKISVSLMPNGLHFQGMGKKIILLEFFGHSCPPCRASIPGYNTLQKKYADDVVVIAIESWGLKKEKLKHYVKQLGIHYKVAATTDAGKMFKFVKQLTGWSPNYGVPFLMVFSPDGKLAKQLPPGSLNEPYVEKLIESLRKQ